MREGFNNEKVALKKGNISEVFSDGKVVYRDLKPQSKSVHRLLLHLEEKGIGFTPRFLGINEDNMEMLSFVEGDTIDDYPIQNEISKKITTVRMAAEMLRKFHDGTVDFIQNPDDIWFLEYKGELQKEVICHNDFAPYNVTFQDLKPVGLIDFDTACPAPRIWDVAYAAYRFVPLSGEVYDINTRQYRRYSKSTDSLERKLLLHEFLDSYGMKNNAEVLQTLILRLQDLVLLFDEECKKGSEPFIKMKESGHQQFYIREITFIKENMADWI